MNVYKDSYIILEIIPTSPSSEKGFVAQLSALKIDGLKLVDRFDYRVEDHLIENDDLKRMIQYDKRNFTYVNNIYFIMEKFKQWAKDLPFLIIEGDYTLNYLKEFDNKKELVYQFFDIDNGPDAFVNMIEKYRLIPSDHIVDLVYEALMFSKKEK